MPPQSSGESRPESWCEGIQRIAYESSNGTMTVSTRIVRPGGGMGDDDGEGEVDDGVGYDEFVATLRDGLANDNVRVACNFLRSALMGLEGGEYHYYGRYAPSRILLSMFGGHFSPIVGIIDGGEVVRTDGNANNNDGCPYVAIFDTNHRYNGVYFAPARRLYDAIRTVDVGSKKRRAIILVEKVQA